MGKMPGFEADGGQMDCDCDIGGRARNWFRLLGSDSGSDSENQPRLAGPSEQLANTRTNKTRSKS